MSDTTDEPQGQSTGQPKRAGEGPVELEIEEGRNYAWCACGRSQTQPFCDGSHKGTGLMPNVFKAERTGTVYFCMCKHTKTPPFCDGSHER